MPCIAYLGSRNNIYSFFSADKFKQGRLAGSVATQNSYFASIFYHEISIIEDNVIIIGKRNMLSTNHYRIPWRICQPEIWSDSRFFLGFFFYLHMFKAFKYVCCTAFYSTSLVLRFSVADKCSHLRFTCRHVLWLPVYRFCLSFFLYVDTLKPLFLSLIIFEFCLLSFKLLFLLSHIFIVVSVIAVKFAKRNLNYPVAYFIEDCPVMTDYDHSIYFF